MGEKVELLHHSAAKDQRMNKVVSSGDATEFDTLRSAESAAVDGADQDAEVSSTDEGSGASNGSTTGDSVTSCEKHRQTPACKKNCLKSKQCLKVAAKVATTDSSDLSDLSSSSVASSQTNNSNDTKTCCKQKTAMDIESGISGESGASSESNAATAETSSGPETSNENGPSVSAADSSSGTQEADAKANSHGDGDNPSQTASSVSHYKGDTEDNDQSDWTISEDLRLRGMKESTDNLSWADIGKSLNRGKTEVKARWKAIKDQKPEEYATDTDTDTKGDHEAGQCHDGKAKNTPTVTPAKLSKSEPPTKQTIIPRLERQKKHRNDRLARQTQGVELVLSGDKTSSASQSDSDERRRQKRYLYHHVYNTLYPAEAGVAANEHLTEWDRAMLATIACMHTTNKLLEMKANFMNATGADVPIAVLRDWYEGHGTTKEEHPNAVQQEDSTERVEKWIDSVSMGSED